MNKAMFPALKFLSLDYAYENIMKQKLAISWMLIPFPKGILQDEDYIHNNIFLNGTYRRPWKISIPTCKVHDEDSITDVWKKYASIAEFLEKKGKPFDIVPSSNPCSQIDLEEVYSLTESYAAESMHTHEECWNTILSTDVEDFFLGDEIVFVNYLVQFGQHLPSLETLLSRLKTFSVQDPLIGLFRILSAKETLYRMNASIEENLEPNILLEEFHQLSPGAEESLSLPCTMELDEHAIDGRSSMSELTTVLQLAPEQMPEVEGLADTAGLTNKILFKNDFIEQSVNKRNLDPCKYEEVLDTDCFRSYHEAELEVNLTPPRSVDKDATNKMCVKLTTEEMSPASPNFHITDAAKDILECLESNIDTKLLLLKVPHIQNKPQRLTIDELKQKISVNPEKSVAVTLEDNWWSKLGLIEKYNQSIEPLTANIPRTHNLAPSTMESVNRVAASQLERILEQKVSPMKQKASFHNHEEQSVSHDSSPSKIIVIQPPIQGNVNVPFADSFYTADYAHLVTHENEKVQSDVFLQNLPSTTTVLSINHVKPAEINLRDTCILHKSLDSGLRGPEKQANDDTDLLSSFISLRTKSSLVQGENKQTEKPPVQADKLNSRPEHKENHVISCDSISEARTQKRSEEVFKNHLITVHITPSDSQCQVYRVLQAEAVPVINKLVSFCVSACMEWNFASVTFDCTRFLLRQQEKIISDSSKIEYLSKARHMYKSALGPCLDDMWRKLRIVQFVRDKTEEVNPKITALLQEMEKANMEHQQLQVNILQSSIWSSSDLQ